MANGPWSNDPQSHTPSLLLATLRPMVGLSRQNFFFGGNALFHCPPRPRGHPPTPATAPPPLSQEHACPAAYDMQRASGEGEGGAGGGVGATDGGGGDTREVGVGSRRPGSLASFEKASFELPRRPLRSKICKEVCRCVCVCVCVFVCMYTYTHTHVCRCSIEGFGPAALRPILNGRSLSLAFALSLALARARSLSLCLTPSFSLSLSLLPISVQLCLEQFLKPHMKPHIFFLFPFLFFSFYFPSYFYFYFYFSFFL